MSSITCDEIPLKVKRTMKEVDYETYLQSMIGKIEMHIARCEEPTEETIRRARNVFRLTKYATKYYLSPHGTLIIIKKWNE